GISTSTSRRLLTRAPRTRMRSWLSATWRASASAWVRLAWVPFAVLTPAPFVRRPPPSRRRLLHERGDALLDFGRELRQRVRRGPHRAVVEVGLVLEPQRGIARLELLRALEEAHDLAVLGVGGHAVPRTRRQFRRGGLHDGVQLLGQCAVGCIHLADLREDLALPVRLLATTPGGSLRLLGAFLHRGAFLGGEAVARGLLRCHRSLLTGVVRLPHGLLGGVHDLSVARCDPAVAP